MNNKNKNNMFSYPQTGGGLVVKKPTFWDLAEEKAKKIKETRLNQPNQISPSTTPSTMQGSFQKMIGGNNGIGSGGFYNSMAGLEAASMRLADAASKRSMQESEKEYGLKESQMSKLEGYSSPEQMYSEIRNKKQMKDRGYVKFGGRWIKQ